MKSAVRIEWLVAVVVTMAGSAWLGGCGNRYSGDEDGAGASPQSVAECTGDADCAASEICVERRCLPACQSADDCEEGEACVAGNCQPTTTTQCAQAADCSVATYCHLASGACVECLLDDHCDTGLACLPDHTCGDRTSLCRSDADCPGEHCHAASGQCVTCTLDAHCGADMVCRAYACEARPATTCSRQSDCAAYGKICDTTAATCRGCLADAECGSGRACSAGVCNTPGTGGGGGGGGGGGDGGLGDLFGPPCETSADCDGLVCLLNMCLPCFNDMMCLLETMTTGVPLVCDTSSGRCVEPS